jgi:hypothetical protein
MSNNRSACGSNTEDFTRTSPEKALDLKNEMCYGEINLISAFVGLLLVNITYLLPVPFVKKITINRKVT